MSHVPGSRAAAGGHLILGAGGKRIGELAPTKAAAAVGSVSLACMGVCRAPVILAKPKGTPVLDSARGMQLRLSGQAGTKVVVTVDGSLISQKCFDMGERAAIHVAPQAARAARSVSTARRRSAAHALS